MKEKTQFDQKEGRHKDRVSDTKFKYLAPWARFCFTRPDLNKIVADLAYLIAFRPTVACNVITRPQCWLLRKFPSRSRSLETSLTTSMKPCSPTTLRLASTRSTRVTAPRMATRLSRSGVITSGTLATRLDAVSVPRPPRLRCSTLPTSSATRRNRTSLRSLFRSPSR